MMKRIAVLLCCLCLMFPMLIAAAETVAETDTEFDVTAEQKKNEELGIPTTKSVNAMKLEADKLWNQKDYKAAAVAYAEYAKQANWLANIISAGLEPYYSASYDSRKNWSPWSFSMQDLVAAEKKANQYKSDRNRALLYEALCYYHQNDYETALPLLINALDLIEISEERYWDMGMDALYTIVQYK